MRRLRTTSREPRIEMTPMIDVVFLLLTFFIFSMVLMVRARVVDVSLPSFDAGQSATRSDAITLSVDAQGDLFVDSQPVDRDTVIDIITAKRAAHPSAVLYLAADTQGTTGDLLHLIDLLANADIKDFQLIGSPPETPAPSPDTTADDH